MAKTLLGLAREMELLAPRIEKRVNKLKIAVAREVLESLIAETPVDTTAAVSNWQVALNNPVTSEIPAYFLGRYGETEVASRNAALRAGLLVIKAAKPNDTIIISNLLDYIGYLEDGHSSQPPGGGFVASAIQLGRLEILEFKVTGKNGR